VDFSPARFRPQSILTIARLVVEVTQEYLNAHFSHEAKAFSPRLDSIRRRLDVADAAHEAYLARRR